MVVVFTITYAIGAYHHWGCELESRSGRDVQHYVIKLVSDLRPVCDFSPVSFTNTTDRHDITEILLKVVLNAIIPSQFIYIDRMIDQCLKIIHLLKHIIAFRINLYLIHTTVPREVHFILIQCTKVRRWVPFVEQEWLILILPKHPRSPRFFVVLDLLDH